MLTCRLIYFIKIRKNYFKAKAVYTFLHVDTLLNSNNTHEDFADKKIYNKEKERQTCFA